MRSYHTDLLAGFFLLRFINRLAEVAWWRIRYVSLSSPSVGLPVLGVYLLYALVCYFLSRSIIPTGRMIKVVFIFSAVLDDIGGRRFTQKTKEGFDDAFENYDDWINTLTNNGTSYPDLNSRSNFNAEFMTHLNNFQKYGEPGYTNNSTILPNLNPEALKKYFNNTLNCNN